MSKKRYSSLACALALAASFSTLSVTPVYAAPEEEAEETVVEEAAPVQEQAVAEEPAQVKRMPTPEEVDAMLSGNAPEMVQSIAEDMKVKAERKGQQLPEGTPETIETTGTPIAADAPAAKPELPEINDNDIPVEMRTVKPEGYDPNPPKVTEVAVKTKENADDEDAEDEEAENVEVSAEKIEAEKAAAAPVTQAPIAKPQETVKPVETPAPEPEPKVETEKEKKARLKAEKKAQKEKEKQERKAKKEREKLEKAAKKAGKEIPAAKPETSEQVAVEPAKPAVTSAGNSEKAVNDWTIARPSEQIIVQTMEKLQGRTIVDVNIVGAGNTTLPIAKQAVITRGGDYFSQAIIDKDREALFDTGYFYDLYPTFQIVPEGIIVTYNVLENPVLTEVAITGNTVYRTDDLYKIITVQKGEILNAKQLHENLQALEQKYHDDGYVLVKLSGIDVGRDGKLQLAINEGVLEGYSVKGNTKTKDKVIIREMRQKKGEPFNAKKARRGMQRVYNLGYFEDVNMKLNPGVEPNAVVLEVDVVERRTGSFTVGAGYSSRDGFLGMVGFGDKNFRGTGQSFHISYEFGGDDWDAQGIQFTYRWPWIDRHETALGFKFYNRKYEYDDYDTHGDSIEDYMRWQAGFDITLSRPQTEYTTNLLLLRNRNDKYDKHKWHLDRSTSEYKQWRDDNFGLTRSITFNHVTDTRDNIYYPTEGGREDFSFEYAGFGGKFRYEKVSYEQSHFTKVGHAQVFAWRWAYGRGFGHIPEVGQYRLGGQDTIRGYRDDCFRGNSMYLASIEYRFPIVRKVNGAIFADAGAAWFDGWNPHGTKGSVGFGVSIDTPVGPIRLDLGHGAHGNRVHFSMGGAF